MTTKKFALCKDAERAALHYGDNASQGILHMVDEIDRLQREIKKMQAISEEKK